MIISTFLQQIKWIGLMDNVCDEHDWFTRKCDHEQQLEDHNLPWFELRDNDFEALQKFVLEPQT